MPAPCSELTREVGEPLAGTAGEVHALIALAWPKPLWDPEEAARSKGLPSDLGELLASRSRSGEKTALRLFQRAPGVPTDRLEIVGLVPRQGRTLHLRDLPLSELPARVEGFLEGRPGLPALDRPLALVCTDGRHDRCCARFGSAVFEAVRAEAKRRGLPLDVAESSHLGGHRFAANCLLLPRGELYGRLRPQDVPELLAAFERGAVCVRRFRGRLGASEPEQVAEAYVRARHPEAREVDLEIAERSEGIVRMRARAGAGETVVECRRRTFRGPTRCGESQDDARERWIVAGSRDL